MWWLCARHWRNVPVTVKDEKRAAQREHRASLKEFERVTRQANLMLRHTGRVGAVIIDRSITRRRAYVAVRCRVLCAWLACIREARIADAMGLHCRSIGGSS